MNFLIFTLLNLPLLKDLRVKIVWITFNKKGSFVYIYNNITLNLSPGAHVCMQRLDPEVR